MSSAKNSIMVSMFTSLNRNLLFRNDKLRYIQGALLLFGMIFIGHFTASAQCGLNVFPTNPPGGTPTVTLTVDSNGVATLDEAALTGIINPQGAGCGIFFYDFPSQATHLGGSLSISCDNSTPNGPGSYFVVADTDGIPGGAESAPEELVVVITDTIAPSISGGVCGMIINATTDSDEAGIGVFGRDCDAMVNLTPPDVYDNCFTAGTTLTISYNPVSAGTTARPNETISGMALQDSLAEWQANGLLRRFEGSTTVDTGKTQVIFAITDGVNGTARCTTMVQITDNQIPELKVPASDTVSTNLNCTATNIPGIAMSLRQYSTMSVTDTLNAGEYTDNCGVAMVEYMISGSTTLDWTTGTNAGVAVFNLGLNTVSYRVTDHFGNTSVVKSFDITVIDQTAPVLDAVSDINVAIKVSGCDTMIMLPTPNATDNCDASGDLIYTSSHSYTAPVSFPVGTTMVSYRAIDNAGNSSTTTFNVTVRDSVAPVIACPSNTVQLYCADTDLLKDFRDQASVTDACDDFTLTQAPAAGTALNALGGALDDGGDGLGGMPDSVTITITATDDNLENLSSSCTFKVALETVAGGYTGPVPSVPGQRLVELNLECASSLLITTPTATDDNCPTPALIFVCAIHQHGYCNTDPGWDVRARCYFV